VNLRYTRRALEDISEIANFIRTENPQAAERVRAAILDSLKLLTRFPRIGRVTTVSGVRKLVTRKYRYLVYYKLDNDAEEIVLLTVQHPARKRDIENM